MELNTIISWACNNWFERNDGLIEIYNTKGEYIILNKKFCKIWESINCESTYIQVLERLKGIFTIKDIDNMLFELKKSNLLYIIEESQAFSSIFS